MRAFDADPYFCDSSSCFAGIGGIVVDYDADHLNLEYVRLLVPPLVVAMGQTLDMSKTHRQGWQSLR